MQTANSDHTTLLDTRLKLQQEVLPFSATGSKVFFIIKFNYSNSKYRKFFWLH